MRKKYICILVAVIGVCSLSGCGSSAKKTEEEQVTIGVVTKSKSSEYWLSVCDGMKDAAEKYHADVVILSPDSETEEEVQMPEDKAGFGTYLIIGLIAAGAGAGAWYMKIYKPKHEFDDEEEYEEYEEAPVYEKDDADMQEAKPEERAVLEDEEEEDEDGE